MLRRDWLHCVQATPAPRALAAPSTGSLHPVRAASRRLEDSKETIVRASSTGDLGATRLLGKHQARNGWREGGRSFPLESGQEATLQSVASLSFLRQCNSLPAHAEHEYETEIHLHKICSILRLHLQLSADRSLRTLRLAPMSAHRTLYTETQRFAPMDFLWTPWRYTYVTTADENPRPGVPAALAAWPGNTGCVFCNLIAATDYAIAQGMDRDTAEAASCLVLRGTHCYVCLNAYPYTSGHVMILPYAHLDRLGLLPRETAHEMMDLAQRTEQVLQELYRPQGLNFGMNLGRAAGAGVAGHLHLHALPRWAGDTNFMTTVAETRVLPEDLQTTWQRLRTAFAK